MVYLTMEAANGMLVRVPEDKLEEWTKTQEAIKNGTFKRSEEEDLKFEQEVKKALGIE